VGTGCVAPRTVVQGRGSCYGHAVGFADLLQVAREKRGAVVMGILNVTPDSFSDGGLHWEAAASERRVDELLDAGADLLDIGGESTRPGALPVSAEEQIRRILPAVRRAVQRGVAVSVDTASTQVAEASLAEGATLINDVSCLEDPSLALAVAKHNASLVLMHSRGSQVQREMAAFSAYPEAAYDDIVAQVKFEWRQAREKAESTGLDRTRIFFDPGLGFAKNAGHSWEILTRLAEFQSLGAPIVIGPSRKSFLATLDASPPEERLGATIACGLLAVEHGASVLRVHDVKPVVQALAAMRRANASFGGRRVG